MRLVLQIDWQDRQVLSLMSPFFHETLCGPFKEGTKRQMVLQEDERAMRKVMELACG